MKDDLEEIMFSLNVLQNRMLLKVTEEVRESFADTFYSRWDPEL